MFYVLLTGAGDGCDYTIGCNQTWEELNASTMEEAEREVRTLCEGYDAPSISEAVILEVSDVKRFDVEACLAEKLANDRQRKYLADWAKRRAEYEKLKQEFGS